MIDHTGVNVTEMAPSKAFYEAALAPIGYAVLMQIPASVAGTEVAGFGEKASGKPDFWLAQGTANQPPVHIAFRVASRALVDAFYKAGLAAGGRDNGAPGVRAHYHPNYYGAFLLDPDGHNVEAVCHDPA